MFDIVNGRQTDDGRTPEHGYTISSPCEPNGSGELKKQLLFIRSTILVKELLMSVHTVILFGQFYRLIRESFPIQKWSLFSQFCVFWDFFP